MKRAVMTELIAGAGLDTYYGDSHVLRSVEFAVQAGETVALLGRNGMGKTTLLRTLLGFVRPRRGEIRVRGRNAAGLSPDAIARQGIAYVPEGRGIFATLTVREHLVMAARAGPGGRRDWTTERVLETFPRLAERLGQGGGTLSGGEQQMLTIARALVTNPDLLILDEATEGLAPLIRRELWAVIAEIADSGIASVIVDKNHAAVTRLAARAVILVKGSVVFDGPTATLEAGLVQRHLGV